MVTSLIDRHSRQLQKICLLCLVLVGVDVAKALQSLLRTPRLQPSPLPLRTTLLPPVDSLTTSTRVASVQDATWQRLSILPTTRCSAYQSVHSPNKKASTSLWLVQTADDETETKEPSRIRGTILGRFPSRLLNLVRWRPLRWFRRNKKGDKDTSVPASESQVVETITVPLDNIHVEREVEVELVHTTPATPQATPPPSRKVKSSNGRPKGNRWAVASPNVDFTGTWTLVNSEDFRKEYDEYLTRLGQPMFVRSVALSIIGLTSEQFTQSDGGRELCIRGQNFRGVWERTLVASAPEGGNDTNFVPTLVEIVSADSEKVKAEAWWENQGTVHRSWIRGVTKYGGGDFESIRYLEDNGKIMICESTFHPIDKEQPKANVKWKFQRSDK